MRNFYGRKFYGFLLILMTGLGAHLGAQSTAAARDELDFMNRAEVNRIVFVGNSLMEEAQPYGILEFMMMNAWPGKNLTFRNLGWSGDTAEGGARSYISTPPQPYELLLRQIQSTEPDVVILGYGSIEAYKGPDGLEAYEKSLNTLLDTIDGMRVRSVLLSTIPQVVAKGVTMQGNEIIGEDVILRERNANLLLYSQKMKEIASSRNIPFVDVFSELQKPGSAVYKDNGIHLNEQGYSIVAKAILRSLGQEIPEWNVRVDANSKEILASESVVITNPWITRTGLEMTINEDHLPWEAGDGLTEKRLLIIHGLKRGVYNLSIDHENIVSATAKDWAKGVELKQGDVFQRANRVLQKLAEINELYFWEYRPLNRTYLVGMRKHEQGQNSYELEINSLFIDRLERQIAHLVKSRPQHYLLTQIK